MQPRCEGKCVGAEEKKSFYGRKKRNLSSWDCAYLAASGRETWLVFMATSEGRGFCG